MTHHLEKYFIFLNVEQIINGKFSAEEHHCPGDLQYKDQGAAFPPTCSNPQLQTEFRTATCLPPNGKYFYLRSYDSTSQEICHIVISGL